MKITESEIKEMVIESINRLYEMAYNPREYIPKVRGGWNQKKILKHLKSDEGSGYGVSTAIKWIAEFDNINELRSHIFWHGSKTIRQGLKPSITFPKRWDVNDGGGGYGNRYWGISITSDKYTATNFGGVNSRGVYVHPIILAKNAVIKPMPDFSDALDAEDCIEELWNEGVDAITIGNGGESELLVLNPRAIANMDSPQYFQYYGLYRKDVPNPTDEQLQDLLDKCKAYVGDKIKQPAKPSKVAISGNDVEDGKIVYKDNDTYNKEMNDYLTSPEYAEYNRRHREIGDLIKKI